MASVVVELYVLVGKSADIVPTSGFQKINVDLNDGAGGKYIYLCYKTEERASYKSGDYISEITAVTGDRNTPAPAGYEKIDVDLNMDAGGDYVYLCYQKNDGEPITDIEVMSTNDKNAKKHIPNEYTLCDVDLNKGAGGKYIYLYYKKEEVE